MSPRKTVALSVSAGLAAIVCANAAPAAGLQVVGTGNTLITVDSSAPGTVTRSVAISGIAGGSSLLGIDYRPATPRVLYGLGNTGQLYAINGFTGAATAVGVPAVGTPVLREGSDVGIDFNPSVDRIRLLVPASAAIGTLNYRLNPDTGALVGTDGTVAPGSSIVGAAYTNNVKGGTPTTLYGIDTRNGAAPAQLVIVGGVNGMPSPNTGTVTSAVNLLLPNGTTLTTTAPIGFDIVTAGSTQTAYVSFVAGGATRLYTVDLATGQTTLLGGNGLIAAGTTFSGLAVPLAPFQSMGTTANQVAVGNTLDRFTGVPDAATLGVFAGIDGGIGTPGAQSAALLQLTPTAYSHLAEISLAPLEAQETTILRYTRDLRGNATMPDGSTATLDKAGKLGGWIVGGSRFGRYKGDVDRYGADTDEFHVLGGADFRLTPKIAFGAYGGYSKTNAHLAPNGGAKGDLDSWFVGGYGTTAVGPLYVDGWGSYTNLDWSLARTTTVGAPSTGLAYTDGHIWGGGAAAGLSFQLGMAEIEPFGAVRYADITLPGFGEIGTGPTTLTISDLDKKSLRTEAGARIGAKFEVAGAVVRPQLRGGWYHEFKDQAQSIEAVFNNSSIATPFTFNTTPLRRNYYDAGAALNISGNGKLSFTSDFDSQFDKERRFYTLTIGIRLMM